MEGHRGFLDYLFTYSTTSILSMSSRKSGQAGFATKSMFDVLQNDEPEEEEVEEEDVAVDQVIEYVPLLSICQLVAYNQGQG
jgi:uncharacterized protein YgfB (UPF0149 family)